MTGIFKDRRTAALHEGADVPEFRAFRKAALRKLDMARAAGALYDLRTPPGNRLEALKGDRRGQYSIRINDQWRIYVVWRDGAAREIEIVDYHRGQDDDPY